MKNDPLIAAAKKFMRAADALVNASDRVNKHNAGSISHRKAGEARIAAGEVYDAAWRELEVRISLATAARSK